MYSSIGSSLGFRHDNYFNNVTNTKYGLGASFLLEYHAMASSWLDIQDWRLTPPSLVAIRNQKSSVDKARLPYISSNSNKSALQIAALYRAMRISKSRKKTKQRIAYHSFVNLATSLRFLKRLQTRMLSSIDQQAL